MSATSPRSQIVKRLQDMIPSLGKVLGVVALEAAFQGNVKAETAYVYRIACESGREDMKQRGRQAQVVTDHYAIVVTTKNVKDAGGDDSSDINDDITQAISIALLGWIPPHSVFPLEYVRGQLAFQRNMLVWTEIYALQRVLQAVPHHRIVPMNERLFHGKAGVAILKGMPITLTEDAVIMPAENSTRNVLGFAKADAAVGNSVPYTTDGIITLENWNSITGTVQLLPGAYYYLGDGGVTCYMQDTVPEQGIIVSLGRAVSTTTFDIEISDFAIEV